MPTSSLLHTPTFDTSESVEKLINAIEKSEKEQGTQRKTQEKQRKTHIKYEFQENILYYENSRELCDEERLKENLIKLLCDTQLMYSALELCRELDVGEGKNFGVCIVKKINCK